MVRGRPATVLTMRENEWRPGSQGQIFIKSFGWQGGCWVLCVRHLDASSSQLGEMQTLGPETYPQPPRTPCDDREGGAL